MACCSRQDVFGCFRVWVVILWIGSFLTLIVGWWSFGEELNDYNSWNQSECLIQSIDSSAPKICGKSVCYDVTIQGTSLIRGTNISFTFPMRCESDVVNCVEQFVVGETKECYYKGTDEWMFKKPSQDKSMLIMASVCTVFFVVPILLCIASCAIYRIEEFLTTRKALRAVRVLQAPPIYYV